MLFFVLMFCHIWLFLPGDIDGEKVSSVRSRGLTPASGVSSPSLRQFLSVSRTVGGSSHRRSYRGAIPTVTAIAENTVRGTTFGRS